MNANLTAREEEILLCIADGLNNQEIAERLEIEHVTVRKHIANIFSKLDVSNRTAAALLVMHKRIGELEAELVDAHERMEKVKRELEHVSYRIAGTITMASEDEV